MDSGAYKLERRDAEEEEEEEEEVWLFMGGMTHRACWWPIILSESESWQSHKFCSDWVWLMPVELFWLLKLPYHLCSFLFQKNKLKNYINIYLSILLFFFPSILLSQNFGCYFGGYWINCNMRILSYF